MSDWLDMYSNYYNEDKKEEDKSYLYCSCLMPKRKEVTTAIFRKKEEPKDVYDICEECRKEVKSKNTKIKRWESISWM